MAKRILVPVERATDMAFTLRVVRMLASESGGSVRLLAVMPIPEAVRDARDWIVITADRQIERLTIAATEELSRMAALHLDGVPVETSVIFGDRDVEIGVEAECFQADLVVMPFAGRPGPVARIRRAARRLLAGGRPPALDVVRVSALRADPTV